MTTVTLQRFAYTSNGTFGRLKVGGFECYTCELPWRGNQPWVSCIPEGRYPIHRDTFRGLYDNFALAGVPGRWNIEFHRGNTMRDVKGCIILGLDVAGMHRLWGVTESKKALDRFMAAMDGVDEAELVVTHGEWVGDYPVMTGR